MPFNHGSVDPVKRASRNRTRLLGAIVIGGTVACQWGCASDGSGQTASPASRSIGKGADGEASPGEKPKTDPASLVFIKIVDECAMAEKGTPAATRRPAVLQTLGANRFRVECADFDRVAITQTKVEWCWAACAQMVLAYNRKRVNERELVEELGDGAADDTKVLLALCPAQRRNYIRAAKDADYIAWFRAPRPEPKPMVSDEVITAISQGEAVVVGLASPDGDRGTAEHLAVIRGVTYGSLDPSELAHFGDALPGSGNHTIARFAVESVDVQDPWPTRGRMTMTGAELQRQAVFFTTVDSACATIEKSVSALRQRHKIELNSPLKGIPSFKLGK